MRDHKSLLAWQEAHAVVLTLFPAIRQIEHWYANPIFDQLQRAALSVQLNIAEGYALRTSKRFRNHLDIAYGSAVETAELLELSGELHFLSIELTTTTLGRCRQCQRLLRGLINHLRTY
jgi:four helix bundle protein